MTKEDFKKIKITSSNQSGFVECEAPSNIALIKYWGKKELQIPQNPSLSFTLSKCKTVTKIEYSLKKDSDECISFDFFFEGVANTNFEAKLYKFFSRIAPHTSLFSKYHFKIDSKNTFPHSSGIASSASSMASIAKALVEIEKKESDFFIDSKEYKRASFFSRLGSGSACRSVQGPLVLWGDTKFKSNSSDLYGIPLDQSDFHPVFTTYKNAILIVESGIKKVTSSKGHELLNTNPFSQIRYKQANNNLREILKALSLGDIKSFIEIVESEALMLHALMMTSTPNYILMKPNTLAIINRVRYLRDKGFLKDICFTLDAGANVHLLYPEKESKQVHNVIQTELLKWCENDQVIFDEVSFGL